MQKSKSIWMLALTAVLSLCLSLVCVNFAQPQTAKAEGGQYLSLDDKLSYLQCGKAANDTQYLIYLSSTEDLPHVIWGVYPTWDIVAKTDKGVLPVLAIYGCWDAKTFALYFDVEVFNQVNPNTITIEPGTRAVADANSYTGEYAGIEFTSGLTLTKTENGWSLSTPTPVTPTERTYLQLESATYDFISEDTNNYAIFFRTTVDLPHLVTAWHPYKTSTITVSTDKGELTTRAIYGTDQSKLFGLYFEVGAFKALGATQITISASTKIDANDNYNGQYLGIEFKNAVTIYKTEGGWSHDESVSYDEVAVNLATANISFTYSAQFKRIQFSIPSVCDKFDAWKSLSGTATFYVEYGEGDKTVNVVQTNPDDKGLLVIINDADGIIYRDSEYITLKSATLFAEDYKLKIVLENSRTFSKDTEFKELGNVTFQQTTGNANLGFLSTCEYSVPMDSAWEVFNDFQVTAYKADGSFEQISAFLQNADAEHTNWLYIWIKDKTQEQLADYTKITVSKDTTVTRDYGWKKGVKFTKDVNYYNFEGSWGTIDPSTIVKEVVSLSYIHNEWNNMTGTNYGTYCTLLVFSSNIAVSNGSLVRENRRASILVNGNTTTAEQLTYSHAHGRNTLLICINDESLMVEGTTIELLSGFGFETATLGEGVKLELGKEEDKWVFTVASNEGMKPLFTYSATLGEQEVEVANNELVFDRTEGEAFDLESLMVSITDKDEKNYTATIEGSFDAALADGKYIYKSEEGATNIYTVLYKFDTTYGLVTVSVKLVVNEKDSVAPVIEWEAGTDLTLDEGYDVSLITVSATDDVDGEVEVIRTWSEGAVVNGLLVAGKHTLTLTATDAAGNKAEMIINITVEGGSEPITSEPDTSVPEQSSNGSDSGSTSGSGCVSYVNGSMINMSLLLIAASFVCSFVKKAKNNN